MAYNLKFSRSVARLRAPVFTACILTFAGCNSTDSFTPDTSAPPTAGDESAAGGETTQTAAPVLATTFAGGIPMGTFALPTSLMGSRYNGSLNNDWPAYLLAELAAVKARGGKVILTFTGNERYYRDSDGHFSFSKWKERVNRFRSVNFNSYINDGTIIGHYLMDEPNDPSNWNGRIVPGTTVEEMAKYSKSIWPNLPTIVRTHPGYLAKWGNIYRNLDAAWAQYLSRRGNVNEYIRENVADAQKLGLALVVGLNLLHGGSPNGTAMSASEVENWGSALLSSSYPCAFISWQYNSNLLSTSSMKSAMDQLRRKAENRATKSCRGS